MFCSENQRHNFRQDQDHLLHTVPPVKNHELTLLLLNIIVAVELILIHLASMIVRCENDVHRFDR